MVLLRTVHLTILRRIFHLAFYENHLTFILKSLVLTQDCTITLMQHLIRHQYIFFLHFSDLSSFSLEDEERPETRGSSLSVSKNIPAQ